MNAIRFRLNGARLEEGLIPPSTTVLDYIRDHLHLTGTKEGCAEGDCGACTVAILKPGSTRWEAVNSCIMLVPQLDGCAIRTVEGVSGRGPLHPVQKALAEGDGTQCGFCTPGFVMSLFAVHQNGEPTDTETIHDVLAGNLCRCTGYRPIVDACKAATAQSWVEIGDSAVEKGRTNYRRDGHYFIAPSDLPALIAALAENPGARLVGGATDLGLLAGHERQVLPALISTAHVAEMKAVEDTPHQIVIGGAATFADALPLLDEHFPAFGELVHRIGSRQIRSLGTFSGNLGTASPVGDTLPCLIALGAEVELASQAGSRTMKVEDFILGYRKTDLKPGEVIAQIRIPKLRDTESFAAYKISKRYDQDISIVLAAFRVTLGDRRPTDVVAAFGGMADRAKRARMLETELVEKGWTALDDAEDLLAADFTPLSDHRGSEKYRRIVAANLVRRMHLEVTASGVPLRLEVL
ncbi:xanthine dehydrogenase small subunit [Flaviflagellibacter deserti]|uniref:Xanthine dehydrogenase small subunit n=1 Tax=Flaviflagellibacter deserti TaxID=2267266 RepID=A0ABV9Z4H4_9HYPH